MLVVTRNVGQRVFIDVPIEAFHSGTQEIRIEVICCTIRGDKVRIGLKGSDEVQFTRDDAKEKS